MPAHLCIHLATAGTRTSVTGKKLSRKLAKHLSRIDSLFPLHNHFLGKKFAPSIPSKSESSPIHNQLQGSVSLLTNHKSYMLRINHTPEMIISINCLIAPIAEVLPTITAYHLVATIRLGNSHLTRWALFGITKYFLNTKKFINHFSLLMPLLTTELWWVLSLLQVQTLQREHLCYVIENIFQLKGPTKIRILYPWYTCQQQACWTQKITPKNCYKNTGAKYRIKKKGKRKLPL